jgi:hypothetical protein
MEVSQKLHSAGVEHSSRQEIAIFDIVLFGRMLLQAYLMAHVTCKLLVVPMRSWYRLEAQEVIMKI